MNAKDFVDSLFAGYEQTAELTDFKEELLGNLNAKIESFIKKGMDSEAAFEKASAELGDVSALADELSLKKRKEVFEEVYMDVRNYMSAPRVAAYVGFGLVLLFGLIAAFMVWFGSGAELQPAFDLASSFGALMPFLTAAAAGFCFLGLTQETASAYPMKKKRAAWYALSAALIAFGISTAPIVYFTVTGGVPAALTGLPANFRAGPFEATGALGVLLSFTLPGGGLLAFLVLTEKDRLKPWAKEFRNNAVKREMEIWNDPASATRFGLFSGAIWIFAAGLFVLFGFLIGFRFSWLVFVFAIAVQLLVQAVMCKQKN